MRSAFWPIAARIALSGGFGVFASVSLLYFHFLRSITCLAFGTGCRAEPAWALFSIYRIVVEILSLTVIALVLVGPLIAIAITAGLIFRRSIERHLLSWSLSSPIAAWLFVCVVSASMRGNVWSETPTYSEKLWVSVAAFDNLLFLFGPMVSSLAFYTMSAARPEPSSGRHVKRLDRPPTA